MCGIYIEAESRAGTRKRGLILVKGYKVALYKTNKSRALMYSMTIIVNNTVLYIGNSLRENLGALATKKKKV